VASRRGLEPLTPGLGNLCSIQLSYRDCGKSRAAKTLWTGRDQPRHALSMNFRFAHGARGSLSANNPLLCGACLALLAIASPCLAACGRVAGRAQVASVDERLDIELADGRTVRLGGLDAPNADHGASEIANKAREFLGERLLSREVDVMQLAGGTDRWGRTVADLVAVNTQDGPAGSTAAALLAAGYARVRPEFETRGCVAERLAIEEQARQEEIGIWRDPAFTVIQSSNSAELRRRNGQFVVVEGMVRRVGFARSRIYLELVPRDGPTIVVARKLETALAREGRPVGALVGQMIRARGALDDRFGSRIEVADPAMIEIARRVDASGEAKP
jgi:endonuclease YncB( thermonuclease family)